MKYIRIDTHDTCRLQAVVFYFTLIMWDPGVEAVAVASRGYASTLQKDLMYAAISLDS